MKLTGKQEIAARLLCGSPVYYLFYGATRSGKSWYDCRYLILRAAKYPGTRHLLGKYRFNSAKVSSWMQTLMPLVRQMLPAGSYVENKTDHILEFANGSSIWLAGFDDAERAEKIFGTEYATIVIQDAQQLSYETFEKLKTRLNSDNKEIKLKFVQDANPRGKSHWHYRVFHLGLDPRTRAALPHPELYAKLHWRVEDNLANLSPGYVSLNLDTLTGVARERYRMGNYADQTEGAVYRFDREVNHVEDPIAVVPGGDLWCGMDFGINADVFLVDFQIVKVPIMRDNPLGIRINIVNEYVKNNEGYLHYANVIKSKDYWKRMRFGGDPSGRQRDSQLKSWFSRLAECGINVQSLTRFSPADMIDNVNRLIRYVRINEDQCPHTVDMFENWGYPVDRSGNIREGVLPNHDKYSHPGTALYYGFANAFSPIKETFSISSG